MISTPGDDGADDDTDGTIDDDIDDDADDADDAWDPLDANADFRPAVALPEKERILDFIRNAEGPVDKRAIAREFGLKGAQRAALRELLRECEAEGLIDRGKGKKIAPAGALPEVAVLVIDRLNRDGEPLARPTGTMGDTGVDQKEPHILVTKGPNVGPAPREGDRVLARLRRVGENSYEASVIRTLKAGPSKILGLLEPARGGAMLVPTDKRSNRTYLIERDDLKGARGGDLVLAESLPGGRHGPRAAKVVEVIGDIAQPRAFSLIAIHQQGIPVDFPEAALAEAEKSKPPTLGGREDLRDLPLITIDGADARDFDDAVYAEPDDDTANAGGWRILVAIADVAHYVSAEGPLDKAAQIRGNSVYFPDRVVPMLPEVLSNGLCSLRPNEDRACMAVWMTLDKDGRLKGHRFMRGLMRSAARLTYEQVQQARDGAPDETTAPLMERVITPLYGAYNALLRERAARGTLELDLPELQVVIGEDGKVAAIRPRDRLDSHELIEEFMIAANVATAEALEAKHAPAIMYRVHEPPPMDKLEALRDSLKAMNLKLAASGTIRPSHFTGLLSQVAGTEKAQIVSDLVLRSQNQAIYSPENQGHFGLALRRYCHFTSPIRRYSDLLVHRALITTHGFGKDGLPGEQTERFEALGEQISNTERRAIAAEREATDRYLAAFMADRVGATFKGRITGVKRFGLFIRLDETGADGLVPTRSLPRDRYWHDEVGQRLIGEESGLCFTLAERVEVRLVEATPVTGGLILEITDGGSMVKDRKARRPKGSAKKFQNRGGSRGGPRGGPKRGRRR